MSERISGRHALRHLSHKDNTNDLTVFRFAGSRFGRPAFHGDTELRARQLFNFTRCFTRDAGTPPSILCFRAPGNLPRLESQLLLARTWKDGLGMVMRAHAEMSSDCNKFGLVTTSTNGSFLLLL